MSKNYEEIIKAVLEGRSFRELILMKKHERMLKTLRELILYVVSNKSNERDWWKKKLIIQNKNKKFLVWCGGLNEKTIRNWMGSTSLDICRRASSKNYDIMVSLFENIIKKPDFPKLSIRISLKDKVVELNNIESLLLIFAAISAGEAIRGGIWSEVGKRVGSAILEKLFNKLGIPKGPSNQSFYYQLEVINGGREADAVIFYKGKNIHRIEIKLLGIGNPEIGDEAIARGCDIFLVDDLTDLMKEQARKHGVRVILLRNALEELYEIFSREGLPVKKP